jgi:hypothetical protein
VDGPYPGGHCALQSGRFYAWMAEFEWQSKIGGLTVVLTVFYQSDRKPRRI